MGGTKKDRKCETIKHRKNLNVLTNCKRTLLLPQFKLIVTDI